MNKSIFLSISLIIFLSFAAFQANNNWLGGYLSNKDLAAKELKSTPESLFDWKLSDEAPFKYRVLFRYIVEGAYSVTNSKDSDTFFLWLKYFNLLFLISSAISLFYLLILLFQNVNYALSGTIIYLLSPAIIMAFSLPVHTREDHLGFTILNIGLYAMLRKKWGLFVVFCILGVMTRETLMILPFVYLFFTKHANFLTRLSISSLPFIVLIVLHIVLGHQSYDMGLGLRWNLNNLDQVFGFAFITFSWMWIPFLYNFKYAFGEGNGKMSNEISILIKSAPFVLILVAITTFFGGVFNEIRLLYILNPWVIVSSLYFIKNIELSKTVHQITKSIPFIIFVAVSFVAWICLSFYAMNNYSHILPPFKYNIPVKPWIIISAFHAFLFCVFSYIFVYHIKQINRENSPQPTS